MKCTRVLDTEIVILAERGGGGRPRAAGSSPIAISQYVVAAVLLLAPLVFRMVTRRRQVPDALDGEVRERERVG